MDDLEERGFGPLPDETWVYPGRGDDTTLGMERPSIPKWRARGWQHHFSRNRPQPRLPADTLGPWPNRKASNSG